MFKKKSTLSAKSLSHMQNLGNLGFDNSPLANIIVSPKNGKIILINNAVTKLLGYSSKILLTQSVSSIFNITQTNFKKILKQRNSARKPIMILAIKKDGKPIPCEMNYTFFEDENGTENVVISIEDMSRNIMKQLHIDIKKEKIVTHNIFLAKSKQKNIDTKNKKIVSDNIVLAKSKQKKIDIKKDKIVSDNITLAKSKQKNIDIKNKKIVSDNIVLAKSKQKEVDIKKDKIVSDNITLAKSKQKNIDIKNKKIVSDNIVLAKSKQKKVDIKKDKIVSDNIILAQAKSDEEKLNYENYGRKQVLIEIEENFRIMFNLSSDVLFDSDLVADTLLVNDTYEKEFGYKQTDILVAESWADHIHPEDKKRVMKDYYRILRSEAFEWKCGYRFLRHDNSVATVLSSRIILRDTNRKAFRMIGLMQDVSKQKVLEERLEDEIRSKELQISEAAEDAKFTERSDIGKELHDNINQLLSASKLYLDMAKRGGENSEMYLSRSSEYTLAAIEEIRKLTKGLTTDIIKNLGLCEAIEIIVHDTMQTSPLAISCHFKDFKETSVNDKFKLNIYRIIQEQLNNILKHANATNVMIDLLQDKQSIKLKISDNGVGFDTAKKGKGIGVSNIKSRAVSYDGIADFVSQPGQGCVLTAIFTVGNKLLISA